MCVAQSACLNSSIMPVISFDRLSSASQSQDITIDAQCLHSYYIDIIQTPWHCISVPQCSKILYAKGKRLTLLVLGWKPKPKPGVYATGNLSSRTPSLLLSDSSSDASLPSHPWTCPSFQRWIWTWRRRKTVETNFSQFKHTCFWCI